ncbi:glycine cleavage system aminomethyltransferase GcvT [Christensenellaceae bacterium OttesenSCG-928-L17]|nr:glycine cleavage system aminomethyltransferase GcvT [Christensenellaceae bacterium OttesenSCG-928-L17]
MDGCKKTPLYETHLALGGKLIDFGGWALPVQYSSILEEHKAVRERAGLFDVSHMGEIFISGPGAFAFLQYLLTNDYTGLLDNRCRYSPMCYENGGTVDDVIVYRFSEEKYLVVTNASNTEKDYEWMVAAASGYDVTIENRSSEYAQLALQGPLAALILAPLAAGTLPEKNYSFVPALRVAGVECLVSRTGYTGEDGFELYCAAQEGPALHKAILEAGKELGLLPCALGARDTLRFEASMPLYGHEISREITPREAGLNFAVKTDKPEFIGREALLAAPTRKRIGLKLIDRGIAREHMDVLVNGVKVGETTSGGIAPTLGGNYAMAIVEASAADADMFELNVRGRALKAERVKMPFYKRATP